MQKIPGTSNDVLMALMIEVEVNKRLRILREQDSKVTATPRDRGASSQLPSSNF